MNTLPIDKHSTENNSKEKRTNWGKKRSCRDRHNNDRPSEQDYRNSVYRPNRDKNRGCVHRANNEPVYKTSAYSYKSSKSRNPVQAIKAAGHYNPPKYRTSPQSAACNNSCSHHLSTHSTKPIRPSTPPSPKICSTATRDSPTRSASNPTTERRSHCKEPSFRPSYSSKNSARRRSCNSSKRKKWQIANEK
jgi:hypothetical protein